MLSNRFKGHEKTKYEKVVDNVACINHNKIALEYVSNTTYKSNS